MNQTLEYFKIAIRNLRSRSLRSWLTILGIIIGVFLIVGLMSLSEGIKLTVTRQLKALGGEMIFVLPGDVSNPFVAFMGGRELEKEDIKAIQRTKGVEKVLPVSYQSMVLRYEGEGKMIALAGQDWRESLEILKNFQGWSLEKGRWPIPGKKEVIIGQQVKSEIFKKEVKVGKEVIIKGRKFKVVGILNSLGNKMDDSFVYIDMPLYKEITGEKRGTARFALVKVSENLPIEEVAKNIKNNLLQTRKRKAGSDTLDFSVVTGEKMGAIAENILGAIQLAVLAFASIAIIVGGIGIMNTMFTAVRERIKEIGIMKAVGAKKSAILTIFLFESGIIGLVGGIGGTLIGVIFAKSIEKYAQFHPFLYLTASLSPKLVLFGLVFSFLVGMISGLLPAYKAANLKPVEALRYHE